APVRRACEGPPGFPRLREENDPQDPGRPVAADPFRRPLTADFLPFWAGRRIIFMTQAARGVAQSNSLLMSGIGSSAHLAQLVEHVLGKDEVSGSIPEVGSRSKETGTWRRRSSSAPSRTCTSGRSV